jgi:uroporphyrinogen decarboxylase
VDRYPFVRSIYEHGPALLGKSPGEVSRSAELMTKAALAAWETYHHDLVSVGVDIYNVEAEAFGCPVSDGEGTSVPGILGHPLAETDTMDSEAIVLPTPGPENRLGLIAEAAKNVVSRLADEVWVYACMGGPFSQAVELRGFENLVVDSVTRPEQLHALLRRTSELSVQQAKRLAATGCGVNVFESWATLPLITVDMFEQFVVPYNKPVLAAARGNGKNPPPALIMGGDTARLMHCFLEVGTALVVADYNTDFEVMRRETLGKRMIVRGCVDPKMISRGDWESIRTSLDALRAKAEGMRNFVWGCGAVSYETTAENLLRFKAMCLEQE